MEEETTPRKKTRSLTLPTDPVSRMREIHELEPPVSIPTAEQASKPARNEEILQARNIASNQEINKAMREGLKAPYPEGALKGQLTTVTTRLPAEVCQRLEWASVLTSSKKQDVITEALRLYFEKIANQDE